VKLCIKRSRSWTTCAPAVGPLACETIAPF
jgi:hypothetical protein